MRLLDVPTTEDLAPFSRHLWLQRIAHRVFEEGGRQILELARAEDSALAERDYQAWRSGTLQLAHPDELPEPDAAAQRPIASRYPVILGLIVLAGVVYFFSGGGRLELGLGPMLTILDLQRAGDSLSDVLARLELWRLFTPMLLHFSIPHLLFNCAVVWEVGRRIEQVEGALRLLLLLALLALISNLTQFWVGANPHFGGLSGVAYGLVGFVMVRARTTPSEPLWQLPRGVVMGLLIFLVLFSTGITESFGLHVANGAHWGGLIAGALLALVFAQLFTPRYRAPDFGR